ncbi:MAG TPA: FtsX-like permease family protein [Micavibrio sp.]|nr:FtsX-like permease family protein [Micavibrio sp.]
MKLPFLNKKDRKLGISDRRRYDIPLEKGAGGRFLMLLVCLMTVLGMIALSGTFALSAMKDRWTSGLENQLTIEIPAQDENGNTIEADALKREALAVKAILDKQSGVTQARILSDKEMQELVEPWLGEDVILGQIPMPALISVKLAEGHPELLDKLRRDIKAAVPAARLDTHEEWLSDLVRFTGALRMGAVILALVIGFTVVVAIAGAIRARMAEYKKEVELLHLMGAPDNYIAIQFQNHTLRLCFKGGLFGVLIGAVALKLTGWIYGHMDINLLPDFSLGHIHMTMLAALPLLIALLAFATARRTVLSILKKQV